MKRAYRIVLIAVLVVVAALAGLYATLPWLVRPVLTAELERLGFADVSVSLGHPRWNGLPIHELTLTMYAEGVRVRARLSGARIEYRPALLRQGRVDEVRLGTLELAVEPSDLPVPPTETVIPLPGPWIADLPFSRLSVDKLHVEYSAVDGVSRIAELSGALRHEGDVLEGSFALADPTAVRLHVDARMTAQGDASLALKEPEGEGLAELALRLVGAESGLAATSGRLELRPARLAAALGPWTEGFWSVPATGTVSARWEGTVPENLADLEALTTGSDLSAHLELDLAADDVEGVGRALAARGAADFTLKNDRLGWTIAKDTFLSGEPEALRAPGPVGTLPRPSTLTVVRAVTGSLPLGAEGFSAAELEGAVDLDIAADEIEDLGRALQLKTGLELALKDRTLSWRLAKGATLSGELQALRKADDAGDALPKTATVTLTTPLAGTLGVEDERLDLAVPAGAAVKLEALEYADVVVPEASARLTRPISFAYRSADDWRLGDVHLALAAPVVVTKLKALEKLDALALAVQIKLPTARATPAYTVRDASVGLLGGRVSIAEFSYRDDRPSPPFEVAVQGLDLAKVVALEQQINLQASGLLDGSLPVEIGTEGVKVSGGSVRARAPGGLVRFIPSDDARSMAEGNPGLKLAYDALSNLQYQVLDSAIEYSPAGDLRLNIELKGRNPDWQQGRPIHLNLNVEENVPTLLRSLQLGDDLSAVIEKRVQEFYKARNGKR